jgi:hypothetical protein
MTSIYCGNNSLDRDLLSGNQLLGTRYGCLRKGIGKGMNSPYDVKYTGDYFPIDQRKIYCGNQNELPNGYDIMGNLPQCLQKGIGIGKTISSNSPKGMSHKIIIFGSIIIVCMIILGIVSYYIYKYYHKEKYSNEEKKNNIV